MAKFHEELSRAGVLLDANGLRPSANGWRVRTVGGRRTVVDGPFDDPRALVAGYTLIEVRSRAEALEWTRRFPAPFGDAAEGEIEVRPVLDLDTLPSGEAGERDSTNTDVR
ncbi:MAG: YciI family protein, partial [Caldimonas sp.]